MSTRDAQVYAEGQALGEQWADEDRANHMPAAENMMQLWDEAKMSDQRWARAFYLGALRGYRSVARTLEAGRWGL